MSARYLVEIDVSALDALERDPKRIVRLRKDFHGRQNCTAQQANRSGAPYSTATAFRRWPALITTESSASRAK